MKLSYDKEVDVVYIKFSDREVYESNEDQQGLIIDYDKAGNVVGLEILEASKKMDFPDKFEYETP